MRTSLTDADKVERISFKLMAAGLASAAVFVVGTLTFGGGQSPTDHQAQPVAEFVTAPVGATYSRSVDGSAVAQANIISATRPVDVSQNQHLRQRVNRFMKGDRVFAAQPTHKPRQIARAQAQMFQAWNMLAKEQSSFSTRSSVPERAFVLPTPKMADPAPSQSKQAAAVNLAALHPATKPAPAKAAPLVLSKKHQAVATIDKEAMFEHARRAAKFLQKQQLAARKSGKSSQTTLTAYAPQQADKAEVFDAVLKSKPASNRRIQLGRGDHKWAANRLPKHVYSKRERRCLAAGVYFEARGENKKGQQAVAQVILNRVKNPAYPKTICGVVYQNKRMRNACQFSFACDGIRDRISSRKHWRLAQMVANDAIEERVWLKSVGSSSHYHATYVRPRWRRSMKRMTRIGRHIFYRTFGGGWS